MSEYTHPFRDSTFNLAQAYNYTLLMLIDEDTFIYAITYKDMLLAYDYDCSVVELQEPRELQELLTAGYKNVIISFVECGLTLVPRKIFHVDNIADLARMLDVKSDEKVLAEVMDDKNMVIYKVNDKIITSADRFKQRQIVFNGTGLVKAIGRNNPPDNNIYLNVMGDKLDIVYFKDGTLNYFNSFRFNSSDDAIYFIGLVLQELSLSVHDTTLMVSGNINAGEPLYEHLAGFFPKINLNRIQLMELPVQLPPHHMLPLAALSLCAS
jgi:hypothetical protein